MPSPPPSPQIRPSARISRARPHDIRRTRRPPARRASRSASVSITRRRVDDDAIAVAQQRNRPAARGFGRDVADHKAVRGAAEPAIGDQRHVVTKAAAHDRRGHASISRMPGPPPDLRSGSPSRRPSRYAACIAAKRVFLAIEDARCAVEVRALPCRRVCARSRRARGCRRGSRRSPRVLNGMSKSRDDVLVRRVACRSSRFSAKRVAGDG